MNFEPNMWVDEIKHIFSNIEDEEINMGRFKIQDLKHSKITTNILFIEKPIASCQQQMFWIDLNTLD